MFGPPTDAFRGRRFASDGKVKKAVQTWLRSQPRIFLADGMRRLLNRYTMCFEIRGDYGDKWYAVLSSQIGVHAMIYKLLSLFFIYSATYNSSPHCKQPLQLSHSRSTASHSPTQYDV